MIRCLLISNQGTLMHLLEFKSREMQGQRDKVETLIGAREAWFVC